MIGPVSATTISVKRSQFLFQVAWGISRDRNLTRAEMVNKLASRYAGDLSRLTQAYRFLFIEPNRERQRQAQRDQLLVHRDGNEKLASSTVKVSIADASGPMTLIYSRRVCGASCEPVNPVNCEP